MSSWTCIRCQAVAATAHVELHHNIGAIVARFEGSTTGALCRRCLHRAFAYHMVINCLLGWWGLIPFFMTPAFLVGNVVAYRRALRELDGLAPTPGPDDQAAATPFKVAERVALEREVRFRLGEGAAPEAIGRYLVQTRGIVMTEAMEVVATVLREIARGS